MTKGRLLSVVFLLVVGLCWFFAPKSDASKAATSVTTNEASPASDPKPNSAPRTPRRETAQAHPLAPQGIDATSTPVPGDAALRALQAESVRPWTARRMGSANRIKTLVRGLWTSGNASDPRTSAENFVRDYSDSLFGVASDEVKFLREEITDRTKIVCEQNLNGVPVYGGTLVLFFENGGMSRVQNDLFAKSPTLNGPPANFDSNQAFAKFNASEGSTYVNLSGADAKTILYPGPTSLVYAYEIAVRDNATRKAYRVIYNAESQALIKKFPSQIQ